MNAEIKDSPISDAKREANRKNAKLSTGPRTAAGKARSAANAITHGLCTKAAVVIEGEDRNAYESGRNSWIGSLRPVNGVELFLAGDLFDTAWRIERCKRVETSNLSKNVRAAVPNDQLAQAKKLENLTRDLSQNPFSVMHELRSFSDGCDWVLKKLQWLCDQFIDRGCLHASDKDLLLNLFGRHRDDIFKNDSLASDVLDIHMLSSWTLKYDDRDTWQVLGVTRPKGMSSPEFDIRMASLKPACFRDDPTLERNDSRRERWFARAELDALLKAEIARLKIHRDNLRDLEDLDRAESDDRTACDVSAAGVAVLRYETAYRRHFHQSLRELKKVQSERDPRDEFYEPEPLTPPLDCTLLDPLDRGLDPTPPEGRTVVEMMLQAPNEPTNQEPAGSKSFTSRRFRQQTFRLTSKRKAPPASVWDDAGLEMPPNALEPKPEPKPTAEPAAV